MYIKLKSIRSTRDESDFHDDWIILAGIIDSRLSPDRPVLVRSVNELDIWFGKEFKYRDHLVDLLESGKTLYLFSPLPEDPVEKKQVSKDVFSEIEMAALEKLSTGEYCVEVLGSTGKVKRDTQSFDYYYYNGTRLVLEDSPAGNTRKVISDYQVPDDQGVTLSKLSSALENKSFIYRDYHGNSYSWSDSGQIFTTYIDNSVSNISGGYRDTLFIGSGKDSGYPGYCYFPDTEYEISPSQEITDFSGLDPDSMEKGETTYCYLLDLSNSLVRPGDFIVLKNVLFHNGEPDFSPQDYGIKESVQVNDMDELVSEISSRYPGSKLVRDVGDNGKILLYLFDTTPFKVDYFYRIPNLNLVPLVNISKYLVWNGIKGRPGIKFWSKTVGKGSEHDEDSRIKISVTNPYSDEIYRIIIRRYGYEEIFEGKLEPGIGEKRLDYKISEKSKLVRCEISGSLGKIRTGNYVMSGANSITSGNPVSALLRLLDKDDITIHPDFLLVPDPSLFDFRYDLLREISTEFNMQVLVENSRDNYTKNIPDTSARLLYFDGPIKIGNIDYPGYTLFLSGIFSGEYSTKNTDILYESPAVNPYSESPLEKSMRASYCNYLVSNNYTLYYKELPLQPEGSEMSAWTRLIVSKISREIKKGTLEFLGHKKPLDSINLVEKILFRIQSDYPIAKSVSLEDYALINNKLVLSIRAQVNDLVDSDLSLDITINYNKN